MERTEDGQPTWAMWKTSVLGLPLHEWQRYLADAEKFTTERIATFTNDGAAIRPEDWAPSGDAAAALARFFAWKKEHLSLGEDLDYQETRAATQPPTDERR
ncbi:MAG: hypothetical protein NVSMB19_21320 [Vulcanimicrobiaceae bacterium]